MNDSGPRLTAGEAAALLGVSIDELTHLRRSGDIRAYPHLGDWEYEVQDVEDLVSRREAEAPASTDDGPSAETKSSEPEPPAEAEEPPDPVVAEEPRPAVPVLTRDELINSSEPIASARIIESMAAAQGVTFEEAAAVVDAFWDFLLDADHYRDGERSKSLAHFGTFSLRRDRRSQSQTKLVFVSRSTNELQSHLAGQTPQAPSEGWIDHWERLGQIDTNKLSFKRKLAVAISKQTGLNLRLTFRLLWHLIETVTGIMAADRTPIRWAKRGEMKAETSAGERRYEFRTYKRLAETLPRLPEPKPAARSRTTRTRARRRSTTSEPGCSCSVASILAVLFLVVLPVVLIFFGF